MNTPLISNTSNRAVVRPLSPTRTILNLPQAPTGSEDVTIPRQQQKQIPDSRRPNAKYAAPVVRFKHLLAGVMLASVVGCGTTSGDRMVSGAGIGAGAGAVLGAVTGMGPGTGAAIGAAAGAATGGLTKKKQINLGKPVWR